jgi:hypothetical protein
MFTKELRNKSKFIRMNKFVHYHQAHKPILFLHPKLIYKAKGKFY